jgi:hypothetical protein
VAVRNESVRLSLDDAGYSTGMARAAAVTAVFRKSLSGLDGDSVNLGDSLSEAAVGVDRVNRSSRSAGPEIDRLSGRLRLFRDAAITLGPALIPLGAAAIPALTGSLAALGSAAGGLGVSILALKGIGDALGALNDYELEPTAENLQAARIEMEKLGPAGAHFAQYLNSISDELKTLQIAAREGLLPGLEDGIDLALERLPGVRDLVTELAQGMGQLAESAGADLAPGGGFDEFFSYLDTDAQDTLVSFGNAIGDITNGLADMMVAFAPLNRDFTDGFEGMAQSFADWADGLNESKDFQEFLDYLSQNGPRAIDMLGSLAHSLAAIVKAAAPVGAVTLPVLTKMLDLLGALANSPLGMPFVAALVGITAYSRAVDVATAAQGRFAVAQASGFAKAGTTASVAALVVTLAEYADMIDTAEEQTRIWNESLAAGTLTVDDLKARLQEMKDSDTITGVGDLLKTAMDPSAWIKTSLPGFLLWKNEVEDTGRAASLLAGEMEILGAQTKNTGDLADFFGQSIGQTGNQMRIAAGDATALEGALASLSGWFDKRAAIRDYNASIRELSRSMKNGFTRQDVVNLDAIGENLIQVASLITNPGKRAAFLENARAQLEGLAENGGPRAERAVEKVIRKMEALGLIQVEPTIDANSKPAEDKINKVKKQFDIFGALSSSGTLDANANPFYGIFNPAQSALNRFDGQVATAYLNVVRRGVSNAGAQGVGPAAINNERTASRSSAGRVTGRTSAPTSLTFGRGGDKAAMYGGMFGGGVVQLDSAAKDAAAAVKGVAFEFTWLQVELKKAEKALQKERQQRDAVRDQMNSLASSVASGLTSDIWAQSQGSGNPWAAGATPGGVVDPNAVLQADIAKAKEFNDLIAQLKARGLDGPALAEVLMSGDIERARLIAAMSASDLADYERFYEERAAVVGTAGQSAGLAVFGAALAREEKQLDAIREEVKGLRADVKAASQSQVKATQDTGQSFAATINRTARDGRRRAPR